MKVGEFISRIWDLIQRDWSHLRHSLRPTLEIDEQLKQDIMKILKEEV